MLKTEFIWLRETHWAPFTWVSPQMGPTARAGQDWTWEPDCNPQIKGTKSSSQCPLLSAKHMNRKKKKSRPEPGCEPRGSDVEFRHLNQCLNQRPDVLPNAIYDKTGTGHEIKVHHLETRSSDRVQNTVSASYFSFKSLQLFLISFYKNCTHRLRAGLGICVAFNFIFMLLRLFLWLSSAWWQMALMFISRHCNIPLTL